MPTRLSKRMAGGPLALLLVFFLIRSKAYEIISPVLHFRLIHRTPDLVPHDMLKSSSHASDLRCFRPKMSGHRQLASTFYKSRKK